MIITVFHDELVLLKKLFVLRNPLSVQFRIIDSMDIQEQDPPSGKEGFGENLKNE
jgi:hypothetical protein